MNFNDLILKETSITCRTYVGDKAWLPYLLRSIERFVPIRKEVVIVYEKQDNSELAPLIPEWVKVVREDKFADGRIQQKYSKLTADTYCTGKYIIHIDTDSIFSRNLREDYMFRNGKPILEYTPYKTLIEWSQKTGGANPILWKAGTENAVGRAVEYEFSRRPEKIYPREMYSSARQLIERNHGMSFKEFMKQQFGAKFKDDPKDRIYFSDFNYIGAYLWYHEHDKIHWVNTDIDGYSVRPSFILQMNSYRMLDSNKEVKEEVKKFLETVLESDGETSFENHPDLHYWRDGKKLRNLSNTSDKDYSSQQVCQVSHIKSDSIIANYLSEALELKSKNQLSQALSIYTKIVGIMSQELIEAYFLVGNFYKSREQLDEALTYYNKCLELNPSLADVYFYSGTIYYQNKQLDKAIIHYNKCLELNPNLADAHFYLGTIYYNQQKLDEAIIHYNKCLELNPNLADAHFYLGTIYYNQQKLDEAIIHYNKCLELNPNLADVYFYLGNCYKSQNQIKEAIFNYEKCVELNPECLDAYFYLGSVYFRENKLEKSTLYYEKCLEINANMSDAYFYLGEICIKRSQIEKAIEYHRKYRLLKGME